MYPHPPPSHRPTNYYWILVACVLAMLLAVFAALRVVAGRLTSLQQASVAAPAAAPTPRLSIAPTATASVAAEAAPETVATAEGGAVDVDPKALTESPGTYRSRVVRVRGTVFYMGKLEGGKTWLQIVDSNNVYVDGQSPDPLPLTAAKGVEVEITGIAAGLTNVTAANGKDYDQAFIDPVQKVEVLGLGTLPSFSPAASSSASSAPSSSSSPAPSSAPPSAAPSASPKPSASSH